MSAQSLSLPNWDIAKPLPVDARLFIGLWPTLNTVSALRPQALKVSKEILGRALEPQHWHLTLAFLGQISTDQWQALLLQVPTWEALAVPLNLKLDRFGQFKAAEVLWLGVDPQSQAYHQLQIAHQRLWQRLGKLGYKPEDRNFEPHLSLLRQAQLQDVSLMPVSSICWQTLALKLIVSVPSPQRSEYYQVLDVPIAL